MIQQRAWFPVVLFLLVFAVSAVIGPQLHFLGPWTDQIQGLGMAIALAVIAARLDRIRFGLARVLLALAAIASAMAGLVGVLRTPAAVAAVLLTTSAALAWFGASQLARRGSGAVS